MWFKLFVLLRLPVSVICILGYSFALGAWGGPAMASLGGVLVVGPYVFLASTSMRLVRLRKGALNPAWWLLALETVGGILLLGAAGYTNTRDFELAVALVFASIVLVAWTLPNAVILYSQRAKLSLRLHANRSHQHTQCAAINCRQSASGTIQNRCHSLGSLSLREIFALSDAHMEGTTALRILQPVPFTRKTRLNANI